MLIPQMICACANDEPEESNGIRTILSALASFHPASSKKGLKGLRPLSQHAYQPFVQTVLQSIFLMVIWNDNLLDCIGRKFLTRQMGCVPDTLNEE